MQLMFRHNKFRKYQDKLASDAYTAFNNKKIMLAEAPTGMGKTDAVLGAALSIAENNGLTVFFLTPKISQHSIAMDVFEGIKKKYGLSSECSDIVGRKYMCVHSIKNLDQESFYPTCENLRKNEVCVFHKNAIGYGKEANAKAQEIKEKIRINLKSWRAMNIYKKSEEEELCPYEVMIELGRYASVVIADYYHFFIPKIREVFLARINKKVEKSIVIVDEAHNLSDRLRQHLSTTLNTRIAKKCDDELEMLGYEKLKIEKLLKDFSKKYDKGEFLVSQRDFIDAVESFYGLDELIDFTYYAGNEFVEKTSRRSALLRVYNFLSKVKNIDVSAIMVLKKKENYIGISKKQLDPSPLSSILNKSHASLLMSGTLRPLHMYVDVLGLERERVVMHSYASPFPKHNRCFIIGRGITTRYSKRNIEEFKRTANIIDKIIENSPKGVAVFFPSYDVLNSVVPFMRSKQLFIQKRNAKPREIQELIEQFRKRQGVLVGVQGGSLSEGFDFRMGELKVVIIVGIALEMMSLEVKALIDYYDKKFNKGWQYGYIYPAINRALQAAGRAIRKERDKAAIVFLDERFNWSNYKKLLPNENYIITENPWVYVKQFFS